MPSRRVLAALLAIYSMVIASGTPLPIGWVAASMAPTVGDPAAAERFPCEGCPCGCGTAEHCWSKCCCHTLPQRLAWARREGVRPPEDVLDRAADAGYDITDWRPNTAYRVRLPDGVVAEHTDVENLPPCCRARVAKAAKPPAEMAPTEVPAKPGVSLMQALACQGLAEAWLSFGEAPPLSIPVVVTVELPAAVHECSAPLWCHFEEAPTPPPPEVLARVVS